MKFEEIKKSDIKDAARLALKVWTDSSIVELETEFYDSLNSDKQVIYLCKTDNGRPVAFMNVALRYEYVEGTNSSPVGYLEGIYVETDYRKKGVAADLVKIGEEWAKNKGCIEFASDAELKNEISQKFHVKLGFKEISRIVTFAKSLK